MDKKIKNAADAFLNPHAEIDRHEHHLPHWQQGNVFYFITWRLADALPQDKLAKLRREKQIWRDLHPQPWDKQTAAEFDARFGKQIDDWLDAGEGSCLLRQSEPQIIMAEALKHDDGRQYDLANHEGRKVEWHGNGQVHIGEGNI